MWLQLAVVQELACKRRTLKLNVSRKLQLGDKKMLEKSATTWIPLGVPMGLSDQFEKVQIKQVAIITQQKKRSLALPRCRQK